jgi:UDP-N-acetylglucosamine--N-acetylmuramyl-(pentapeptide) pyrophosphoryl-undecaprenol N-acetylglucosamine transferase
MNTQKPKTIFLIAGRTGGPYFPLSWVDKNFKNFDKVYIGVKNSFEEAISKRQSQKIEFLPEAKLAIFSFKNLPPSQLLILGLDTFKSIFLLLVSTFKSIFLVLKYSPVFIYTTGSFLAVPIILAVWVTNFFGSTKTKIIVHQQDPLPGLSNKFAVRFGHLTTVVCRYTQDNFKQFAKASLIPNPILVSKYSYTRAKALQILAKENQQLSDFIRSHKEAKNKILLVFGGGSGSQKINNWLYHNLPALTKKFAVVHLTGVLNTQDFAHTNQLKYFKLRGLFESMPCMLAIADLVICRSGLASISELLFLAKPAFLVPLKDSHQELNAKIFADKFVGLKEDRVDLWVDTIFENYPKFFDAVKHQDPKQIQQKLQEYYLAINKIIL